MLLLGATCPLQFAVAQEPLSQSEAQAKITSSYISSMGLFDNLFMRLSVSKNSQIPVDSNLIHDFKILEELVNKANQQRSSYVQKWGPEHILQTGFEILFNNIIDAEILVLEVLALKESFIRRLMTLKDPIMDPELQRILAQTLIFDQKNSGYLDRPNKNPLMVGKEDFLTTPC